MRRRAEEEADIRGSGSVAAARQKRRDGYAACRPAARAHVYGLIAVEEQREMPCSSRTSVLIEIKKM